MRYRHVDGTTTTMEFLRPAELVACLGLAAGSRFQVVVPEMGLAGDAGIVSIEPYSDSILRDVPVVTGRFVTDAAEVVDLYLVGHSRPIGVTPRHPMYSVDRRTWVAVSDLRPGECLETATGLVAIVGRVEPRTEQATVYNVEVSQYHTYFVGDAAVWAHNPCQIAPSLKRPPGGSWKGVTKPAVQLGDKVFVAASHGHARHMVIGGNGSKWVGKIAPVVIEGTVKFLDSAGTAYRFIPR
jgi:hypothetical protein